MFYTYFLQKVDSLFYFYYKSLFLFICIYDTTAINASASTAIATSNSPVWGKFVLLCVLSTVIVFSTTSMSLVTFPITIVFSTVLFLSSFLLSSSFLSSSFCHRLELLYQLQKILMFDHLILQYLLQQMISL